MQRWYIEDERLGRTASTDRSDDERAERSPQGTVELMDLTEFDPQVHGRMVAELFRQLPHATIPFVERRASGMAGIIVAPTDDIGTADRHPVVFLLDRDRLRLIGETDACSRALDAIAGEGFATPSAASALCELIRLSVRDHPAQLSGVRHDFEIIEERLLNGSTRIDRCRMRVDSRRLLGLDTLYQGLSDVASELAESAGSAVPDGDRLRFKALERHLDRLTTRLESLRDYSLQLNSLYQEAIDTRQNSVMQWLTVIATIFMPLTFITGWYGMNFPNMAMMSQPWGYALVVVVCLAIAAAEVLFFRRRGWLHFAGEIRPHRRARGAGGHRRDGFERGDRARRR